MDHVLPQNFSRSASTYAAAAEFQRFAAGRLYAFVEREVPNRQRSARVLELGCGTGFLTIGLLQLFPNARFVISDISDEMLHRCREQTRESMAERFDSYFERYDIAEARIEKQYDLILSALAFQWVPNLDAVMANIREHLRPDGRLVFSTLLAGTYSSLHRAFRTVGASYPGPRLMTEDELLKTCAVFPHLERECLDYTEAYPDIRQFLKRIQLTGTGNGGGTPVPVGTLRRVMALADADPTAEYLADYRIANVCCW